MKRRKFLTATTVSVCGTLLAGCSSSDDDYEEGNSGDDGSDGTTMDDGGGGSDDTTTDDGDDSSSNDDSGSGSNEKLKLLDHELVRENEGEMSETVKVTGTAENVSGDTLSYAEVKAKFYDENDTLLDSFLDNVNDFGAGEQWKFEIQYPGMGEDAQEVASYEIAVGTNL